jgi:hypothetical protein
MSLFSYGMTTNCCFSVTGTCTRVWTSNRSSLTVRYAIKRGKSRTAEVTWTMGGKLLRLLFLLSATVALLCSLASAEQGKSIDNIRTCFGLWRLWCVDCAFCFSFRISYVPRSIYIAYVFQPAVFGIARTHVQFSAGAECSLPLIFVPQDGIKLVHSCPV